MEVRPLLAVIPARGGSKGLPGKNTLPLAGMPLIAHSILCAQMCPVIDRCILSTDSREIADVARNYGCEVPFMRPTELATDAAPMIGVLQHALREIERSGGRRYRSLLLLDPTSPGRLPDDIAAAVRALEADREADGVVGVSRPEFNPYWHCVVEKGGYLAPLIPAASQFVRRQDVPAVYRINAALYLWRHDFLLSDDAKGWIEVGKHILLEIPERRAVHIDDADELARADLMIREGLLRLPWMVRE